MRLEGKVALITGGGTGIGLEIARQYVAEGAYVYITGRRAAKLQEACADIGGTIDYVAADVSDKDAMLAVAEKIKAEQGHVDIVMCNAGIGGYVALTDIDEAEFNRVMYTNVLGSYYTVQAFLTGQVKKGMQAGFDCAAGDYRATMPQFKDENIEKSQALLDLLDEMAAAHGVSVPQLSLAWMICKKPWLVPIPGSRKAERIAQNAAAGDVIFSADEIARIDTALDGMDFEVFGGHSAAKK